MCALTAPLEKKSGKRRKNNQVIRKLRHLNYKLFVTQIECIMFGDIKMS